MNKQKFQLRLQAAGLLALLLLAACATPSIGPGGPGKVRKTDIGNALVDSDGMTLYTYDKDAAGKSNCNGMCAVAWPPVPASKSDSPTDGFTIIQRNDGSLQWAHNGMPLYGYFGDSKPGDTSGDGSDGVWHVARP